MSKLDIIESDCVGAFNCSLEMLSRLLGFPKGVEILHLEMLQYGICGSPSVRIVIEDKENLPSLSDGDEVTQVIPKFRLGAGNYREFVGLEIQQDPVQISQQSQHDDEEL